MPRLDFGIYAVHVLFWGSFGLTRTVLRALDRNAAGLLKRSFGAAYSAYCARTRRFIPGIY